jgi:hypothetical protein
MDAQPAGTQPRQIRLATNLLWGFLALGGVFLGIEFEYVGFDDPKIVIGELARVLGFVAIGVIIYHVSRGLSKARDMILALMLTGSLPLIIHAAVQFAHSTFAGAVSVIQILLLPAVLYLLYSKPGDSFFRPKPVAPASAADAATPTLSPPQSGWATAAGALGLASLFFLVPSPFALLAGIIAAREIKKNPKLPGIGQARIGIYIGIVGTLILAIAIWVGLDSD